MTNLTNAALTRSLNFESQDCCLDVRIFILTNSVTLEYIVYLLVEHCSLRILIERSNRYEMEKNTRYLTLLQRWAVGSLRQEWIRVGQINRELLWRIKCMAKLDRHHGPLGSGKFLIRLSS